MARQSPPARPAVRGDARVSSIGDIAKYVAAAEFAIRGESSELSDPGLQLVTAWLLWEHGHRATAARLAAQGLRSLESAWDGIPQIISADMLERRHGILIAARIGLASILALQFAADGEMDKARDLVRQQESRREDYGWSALGLAERSEVYAYLAIANHVCEDRDSALQYLRAAVEPAPILAARSEMQPFPRLVAALSVASRTSRSGSPESPVRKSRGAFWLLQPCGAHLLRDPSTRSEARRH